MIKNILVFFFLLPFLAFGQSGQNIVVADGSYIVDPCSVPRSKISMSSNYLCGAIDIYGDSLTIKSKFRYVNSPPINGYVMSTDNNGFASWVNPSSIFSLTNGYGINYIAPNISVDTTVITSQTLLNKTVALYQPLKTNLTSIGNLSNASGYLYNNGSGTFSYANISAWGLTGNSGTTAGTNFIGTTDNVDLVFKVNNLESGRIDLVNYNTSFGYGINWTSITGGSNSAFGKAAGKSITSGAYNSLFGQDAGQGNLTNSQISAFGFQSLYNSIADNNSGFGYKTLYTTTTGNQNSAVGSYALVFNITGSNNSAFGYNSLKNQTGSYNTALGANTGSGTYPSINNSIMLGYNTYVTGSNMGNISDGSNTLKMGINQSSPTGALDVKGIGSSSSTNTMLVENSSGTNLMTIRDDGAIGIGGISPYSNTICLGTNTNVQSALVVNTLTNQIAVGNYTGSSSLASVLQLMPYGSSSSYDLLTVSQHSSSSGNTAVFNGSGNSVTIDNNARIGSGISSPSAWLHIKNYGGPGSSTVSFILDNNNAAVDMLDFKTGGNVVSFFDKNGHLAVGTSTINSSAIIDVESTTQGFLPPQMTTTQKNAISSPKEGLVVYDTSLNKLSYYNGSTWINL